MEIDAVICGVTSANGRCQFGIRERESALTGPIVVSTCHRSREPCQQNTHRNQHNQHKYKWSTTPVRLCACDYVSQRLRQKYLLGSLGEKRVGKFCMSAVGNINHNSIT